MTTISRALRSVRIYAGLTQAELSKKLSISKSYLSEIEASKKKPSLQLLQRYSEKLDVPLSLILFFLEQSTDGRKISEIQKHISGWTAKLLDVMAEDIQ